VKCTCDFCTGTKKREDNWCARCGEVRLGPGKHWENLDCCDKCEEDLRREYPGELKVVLA
jgi:hypothetical protein